MTPVGLIVGGLGLVIAWSAVTGESIIDTLRETFTTPASQRTPKAAKPMELAGIPIRLKNTFEPDHPGTLITKDFVGERARVDVDRATRSVSAGR